jgi:hypothetical protein
MSNSKQVLLIGTCGIDCFYQLGDALSNREVSVMQVYSNESAEKCISQQCWDAIMINLEPDGLGGIKGASILQKIVTSDLQQDSVCFSVSASSAISLLTQNESELASLKIVAGWLTLPINAEKACSILLDIIDQPGELTIHHRIITE